MDSNTVAAVNSNDGHTVLEATKPFKVTKSNYLADLKTLDTETQWAHTYNIIDGCLVFITMKMKVVSMVNKDNGEKVDHAAVYHTYPVTFAPGTWLRVDEVFVPTMQDKTAN